MFIKAVVIAASRLLTYLGVRKERALGISLQVIVFIGASTRT
jgi:hypothetical protein